MSQNEIKRLSRSLFPASKHNLIAIASLLFALGAMTCASPLTISMAEPPTGWFANGTHLTSYEISVDTIVKHSGKASARIKFLATKTDGFGGLMQVFAADDYHGKRVRMSAWLRSEDAGSAQLWLRLDGAKSMLGFDNMDNRAVKGTSDWKKHEITLDVPSNTVNIAFGAFVGGKGQAWVDDFNFEVVGQDVGPTNMLSQEQMKEETETRHVPKQPRHPSNLNFEEGVLTPEQISARLAQDNTNARAARRWLAANAIRLNTVEARHGFADMQPLKKIIGDARIVSLGEATHGSREFFQLKHRMLEFLATEKGFTIFSIEANMPEAYRLNDYVLNGNGDPATLIKGMYFWTWSTEEVLDMVLWMREFNKSGKGPVQFTGFDMQTPDVAAGIVRDFVAGADPDYTASVQRAIDQIKTVGQRSKRPGSVNESKGADPKVASSAWKEILQHLEASRETYAKKGTATRDIEWAIQNARVVLQSMQMHANEVSRDQSMADNIKWILDHNPGAKIVLWAHNGHVATEGSGGFEPMGVPLRKMFGDQMIVFGFAFNQGSFQAIEMPFPSKKGLRNFTVDPVAEGSLDAMLASAGLQVAAINLRALPTEGEVTNWFREPRASRNIGAGYGEELAANFLIKQVTPKIYDVLLFVEKTTAARPLEKRE